MCPTLEGTVEREEAVLGTGSLSKAFCFVLRFQEKGNLEVLLFTIQSKLRANNQKPYVPHDGKLISDINKVTHPLTALFLLFDNVFHF